MLEYGELDKPSGKLFGNRSEDRAVRAKRQLLLSSTLLTFSRREVSVILFSVPFGSPSHQHPLP